MKLLLQKLKGNIFAYKVYTFFHLFLGFVSVYLVVKSIPPSKIAFFDSSLNPYKGDFVFYLIVNLIFLIGALISLQIKILMVSEYYVLFDVSFALSAFLLFGFKEALFIALFCTTFNIITRMLKMKKKVKELFFTYIDNFGNRMLRFSAVAFTSHLLNFNFYEENLIKTLYSLFILFVVYVLINNVFYNPSEFFKGNSLKLFWKETVQIDIPHCFIMFLLGFFLASVTLKMGISFSILTLILILGAIFLIATLTITKRELTKRVEDLMVVNSVSEAASSNLDLLPMVENFSRKLCEAISAEGIGVVFKHPYSTILSAVQVEGDKARTTQLPQEEKKYQYDSLPLSEPSKKLGEALFEFLQPLETAPFIIPKSCFGLPLIYRGEPIGGLVVYSSNPRMDFSQRAELLETCAHTLIVGMENCFLHLQAIEDPLTGLYNRSYFLYRLKEELSYSSRHQADFALLMIDLDDFKIVNDELGHSAGDDVLRKIGEILRTSLRKEDVPSRYGGDEFIILLINCDENNAYEKANKLKDIISIKALPKEKAKGLKIGCSISVLSSRRLNGENDIPTILKKLDRGLYEAKQRGKNIVYLIKESSF